jgi:hypothetical protein
MRSRRSREVVSVIMMSCARHIRLDVFTGSLKED